MYKSILTFCMWRNGWCLCECWLNLDCTVQMNLLHIPKDTTFQKLFETLVLPKLSNENKKGFLTSLDVRVSALGRGMWKKVCVDDDIGWSLSLGCWYVRFKVANNRNEPPAKRAAPECPSTCEALMTSMAKRDCLPATQKTVTRKDDLFSDVLGHISRYVYIYIYVYNDSNYSSRLLNLARNLVSTLKYLYFSDLMYCIFVRF